jgi:hypothetical protein|tara:strand:- start:575 stop:1006 length:432 start_codon:yes stop_codon:yes gene_type:complete
MKVKIRHAGMVTKNINESMFFWNKLLGFKVKKILNEQGELLDKVLGYKGVKVKTIKLADYNGNLIEILYFQNSPKENNYRIKPYTKGMTHISVTVKNINKIFQKLVKKKIKFNAEPQKSEDGKVLMTYCRTPEGAFLELVEEL